MASTTTFAVRDVEQRLERLGVARRGARAKEELLALMTLEELKDWCRERGVAGYSGRPKAALARWMADGCPGTAAAGRGGGDASILAARPAPSSRPPRGRSPEPPARERSRACAAPARASSLPPAPRLYTRTALLAMTNAELDAVIDDAPGRSAARSKADKADFVLAMGRGRAAAAPARHAAAPSRR